MSRPGDRSVGNGVRTLVVAFDFPPHAAIGTQRTLRFVRHVHEAGWPTAVLTGDPAKFRKGTPVDDGLLRRVPAGVTVIRSTILRPVEALARGLRGGAGQTRKGSAASRVGQQSAPAARRPPQAVLQSLKALADAVTTVPDAEVGWFLPALFGGVRFVRQWDADVIYSSAPPWTGHLVAGAIAELTRRPWVADFRDPWARAPWRSARSHPLANRAAARLERWTVERAAAIIFTTEAARGEFAAHYGETLAAKFRVVPNGCDASMFDGIAEGQPADRFVLLHAGSLYGGRDPRPLFQAIRSAIDAGRLVRETFRLHLLGAVALGDTDLERAAREIGVADVVELLPRADHRASLHAMRNASALLLMQQGTTMSVPAKLYEYLASGKKVFAICDDGETANLVRAGGGVVVRPGDPRALEDALVSFVTLGPVVGAMPDRALFDGAMGAARTRSIVEAVVGGRPAAAVEAAPGSARSGA